MEVELQEVKSRVPFRIALLILVLVFALGACSQQPAGNGGSETEAGSSNNAGEDAGASEDDASAEEPAGSTGGEEVVIGLNISANTLDPHFVGSTQEYGILKNVFEHLVWINYETGGFDPRLATSWEQIDPLTWEFELREGVTFQNGEPFNAEAVKYTIERTIDPEVGSNNRFPGAVHFESVEIIDDYTIRIHTKQPAPTMLTQLWILQIVPPEYYSSTPLDELARKPVGTGPYQVVEWVKDERIVLEAWDDYWGEQPPVERIVYRPLPESFTRLAELETGGIDIAIDVSPDNLDTVNSFEGVEVRQVQSGRRVFFGVNVTVEPFDNPLVRQALNYAIDWDSINTAILNGVGERMASYVTSPHENPELEAYPYDPDRARELLAEAGYPDGFDTVLEVPAARYLKGEEISQAAAANWAEIGINVEVVPLEWSVFSDKVISAKNPDGIFLLGLASAFNPYDDLNNLDPNFVFAPYHWEDEAYLGLLEEYPTADEARQQEISYEAQALLYEEGPLVMLWKQVQLYGVNERVEWEPRPDDYIIGEEISLR